LCLNHNIKNAYYEFPLRIHNKVEQKSPDLIKRGSKHEKHQVRLTLKPTKLALLAVYLKFSTLISDTHKGVINERR
jgi:hypothetical protein